MRKLEGRLWVRPGKGGKNRYYYRRYLLFENGEREEVRRSLGKSLERAQGEIRRLDAEYDVLEKGNGKKATLSQFIEEYVAWIRDERRLLGWKKVKSNLDVILRSLGDMPLREVTKRTLEAFLDKRKVSVRAATVNAYLRDLKRLFAEAVEEGFLEKNPAQGIRALRASPLPVQLPTEEQVGMLLGYLRGKKLWLYRIVLLLLSTGCRLGEALALSWSHVDFTQGVVILVRRKVQDFHKVPMGKLLKDELWLFWTEKGMPKEGCVFLSRAGRPFTPGRVLLAFKPVATKLGMPWLTLRVLRKVAATQAAEATGDIRIAQMLLGHTSVRTTELYLGRGAEAREKAVQATDSFLAGALGTNLGTATQKQDAE